MSDEIFDPEIHSADKDGHPTLNKDGSFRKKRRDSAGKAPRAPRAPRAGRTSAANPVRDQRGRYVKTVSDTLGVVAMGISMVDPVDGYCAGRLVPMWAEGLADLAMDQPWLAATLERIAPLGASTALAGLAVITAVQFAHNHGKIPAEVAKMAGATPREEIVKTLEQRGAALRREAEAARPHPEPAEGVLINA